jgi:hypothetical protein
MSSNTDDLEMDAAIEEFIRRGILVPDGEQDGETVYVPSAKARGLGCTMEKLAQVMALAARLKTGFDSIEEALETLQTLDRHQ